MNDREPSMNGVRVVVTGGTKGIGRAVAGRFAERGADVLIAARTHPGDVVPGRLVLADLSTPEGVQTVAEAVLESFGGADVIVDNAGSQTYVPAGALHMTDADWERDLQTNLLAAVRLDRALLAGMIERGAGVIVHVSSGQARLPGRASLPYAAAKAALITYSKGLANEVGPHGVRVNVVLPGLIETAAVAARIAVMAEHFDGDEGAARRALIERVGVPLGQPGTAEDVADLIEFLASDRARYIHGTQLAVDGGALPTV
jgi:NAD(P)-dependent dehydrogenase (short-subunit alcohol dehydrogenase family)